MQKYESDIKVSICCAVFNHEKYLRKCLDGFVMQKTNFKYEVLIHDDASTDRSADIIKEYENKYPDIIKPIYQKENQYSKGKKVTWEFQYPRATGKYIALCEGDDYWCDKNKLQMQYDALETNQTAVFCVHNVKCISEDGMDLKYSYPKYMIKNKVISPEAMMNIMVSHNSYPFQTSSYFFRADYVNNLVEKAPDFMKSAKVGDVPLLLYFITKGDFIYLDCEMSCYRVMSVGSWSSCNDNIQNRIDQIKTGMATYILFDVFSNGKYTVQVNKLIELQQYHIFQIEKNYKKLCDRKYRWILNQENKKQHIFYLLCGYIPFFSELYNYLKNIDIKRM